MKGGTGTGTLPAGTPSVSGNWKFVPASVPASGIQDMSGVIHQEADSTFVTAVLRVNSPNCYADAKVVPFVGSVDATRVQLGSFDVKDQTVTISATKDATAHSLATSLSVAGGCASGLKQNFTGTLYTALNGTYTGTIPNSTQTLTVSLAQDPNGTGSGTFVLSPATGGTTLTKSTCFSTADVDANASYVSGTTIVIQTQSDPSSAILSLSGSINDTDGTSFTVTPTIIGGTCPGSLGSVTLKKQQ